MPKLSKRRPPTAPLVTTATATTAILSTSALSRPASSNSRTASGSFVTSDLPLPFPSTAEHLLSPSPSIALLRHRLDSDSQERTRDLTDSPEQTRKLRKRKPSATRNGSDAGSRPASILSYETRDEDTSASEHQRSSSTSTGANLDVLERHDESPEPDELPRQEEVPLYQQLRETEEPESILRAAPRAGYHLAVESYSYGSGWITSLVTLPLKLVLAPIQLVLVPLAVARDATTRLLESVFPASRGSPAQSIQAASERGSLLDEPEPSSVGLVRSVVETSLGVGLASLCVVVVGAELVYQRVSRGKATTLE